MGKILSMSLLYGKSIIFSPLTDHMFKTLISRITLELLFPLFKNKFTSQILLIKVNLNCVLSINFFIYQIIQLKINNGVTTDKLLNLTQ